MEVYRLKHKPTGLYWQAHKTTCVVKYDVSTGKSRLVYTGSNLGKTGKVYTNDRAWSMSQKPGKYSQYSFVVVNEGNKEYARLLTMYPQYERGPSYNSQKTLVIPTLPEDWEKEVIA